MRILCINPSIRSPTGWGVPYCHMPLGLAYIAAVLQKDNEVLFLDANAEGTLSQSGDFYYAGLQKDEIVKRVADLHPDAICMTIVFTFNSTNALEILKAIKEKLLISSDDTQIYPGHGASSTIGHERKTNPFL